MNCYLTHTHGLQQKSAWNKSSERFQRVPTGWGPRLGAPFTLPKRAHLSDKLVTGH